MKEEEKSELKKGTTTRRSVWTRGLGGMKPTMWGTNSTRVVREEKAIWAGPY